MSSGASTPSALNSLVQVLDVSAHARHDVGVEDGGDRPLVLAEHRQHLGGQRQLGVGQALQHQLTRAALVCGIGVGVVQGHGDGVDALRPEARRRRPHGILVEGRQDRAVECGAAGDFVDALGGHRAFRLDPDVGVGHAVHAVTPDFQNVLEPFGHQHADGRALALQYGVGGDGGAVEDAADLGIGYTILFEYAGYACDKAAGRVVGCGGRLVQPNLAGGEIQQDNVGEGSADVYREGVVIHRHSPSARAPCRERQSPRPRCSSSPASRVLAAR